MPAIVRDAQRVFPLQAVPYLDVGLDDLFQSMLSLKRANCPNWTDENSSDLGIQLLWLFAVQCLWLKAHLERAKNDCYIGTTVDRESMRLLCELVDYQLGSATAASVVVTFTCESEHPEFTIPAGTQVATEETEDHPAVIFETAAAELVLVSDDSADVVCTQGETISQEVVGSSDGTTGQQYTLRHRPVISQSETVEVYAGTWETWTRADNFVDSEATDKHYRVEVHEDNTCHVIFGDGVNGQIPVRGTNNIRVTYRKGGGVIGNVAANTIMELLSAVDYVESVNNAAAASGGTDRETLDHARMHAPAALKSLNRAVTADDIESLCADYTSSTYGGLAKAKAFIVGNYAARVAIVPKCGGLPTSGLKSALETYLQECRMIVTTIDVVDPQYYEITIEAEVAILPNYSLKTVCGAARTRLVAFLSPAYQDPETGLYPHEFGRNIYISDIWAIINNTPGVDYCSVTEPTGDTIVPNDQIAAVGAIILNGRGEAGSVSFVDTTLEPPSFTGSGKTGTSGMAT